MLVRYGLERLLYRLSVSEHAEEFILKGAMLFALWDDHLEHRPTRDIDLLGRGDPRPQRLAEVFRRVCSTAVGTADGLDFDPASVIAEAIREGAVYEGVRVVMRACLGKARIRVQVDIGFGDAVTPGPVRITYPTLLDHPAPELHAYPAATVVAEKLEAMVSLGIANSRMKDFYDLGWCAKHLSFDGGELVAAVLATFRCRGTALPEAVPVAMTTTFASDEAKLAQWSGFARKSLLADPGALEDVVAEVARFLLPVLDYARSAGNPGTWAPSGPWIR